MEIFISLRPLMTSPAPLILSLESATTTCGVALHKAGLPLVVMEHHLTRSHGKNLPLMVQRVLELANVEIKQLNAIAVSSGPGSYTGLRIGVSMAKGLCFGARLPLISIESMENLLYSRINYPQQKGGWYGLLDAGNGRAYGRLVNDTGDLLATHCCLVEKKQLSNLLATSKITFLGSGADLHLQLIASLPGASIILGCQPSVKAMGMLAYKRYQAKEFVDLVNFSPPYLSAREIS